MSYDVPDDPQLASHQRFRVGDWAEGGWISARAKCGKSTPWTESVPIVGVGWL